MRLISALCVPLSATRPRRAVVGGPDGRSGGPLALVNPTFFMLTGLENSNRVRSVGAVALRRWRWWWWPSSSAASTLSLLLQFTRAGPQPARRQHWASRDVQLAPYLPLWPVHGNLLTCHSRRAVCFRCPPTSQQPLKKVPTRPEEFPTFSTIHLFSPVSSI